MTKKTIKIAKMTCASCAQNIEHSLNKLDGIISAKVNFASEQAVVEYDDKIVRESDIISEIRKIGYDIAKEGEKKVYSKKKLYLSILISLPIFYLSMGEMLSWYIPDILSHHNNHIIQFILTTLVIYIFFDIWKKGFKSLVSWSPGMDSLIFIGTFTAYIYSSVMLFYALISDGKMAHPYFESTVFILVFIGIGKYLEDLSKGKTSLAVKKLIQLQSKTALVYKDDEELEVDIDKVVKGNILIIKPGTVIPLDGVVIEGSSSLDEKMISGESLPVSKKQSDTLIGGTINQSGYLKMRVEKTGDETFLSQIIKIVEDAINSKAPIQKLADKISFYFVPVVISIAIISSLIWLLLGYDAAFVIKVFVSVLIIACPCALGLATPTAVMMGTGIAAENNILIKNTKSLELVKDIDLVVFDKTGTLTKGEPSISDTLIFDKDYDKDLIVSLACSLESKSEHPLAQAFKKEKYDKLDLDDFENISGMGIKAFYKSKMVLIGNEKLFKNNKVDTAPYLSKISELQEQGKTVSLMSINNKIVSIFAISDTLKEDALESIKKLKSLNKEIIILSGDSYKAVRHISDQLGINKFFAEIMPQDKSSHIKKLQEDGQKVLMIGDGINDAPAMAQADLSIAVGSGTDIAIETGDIVLIKDKLLDVIKAIKISNYTLNKIKQNLFWAFVYNLIALPIAAGLMYPFIQKLLSPEIAAVAMVFSSLSVVSNSLLMKYKKF